MCLSATQKSVLTCLYGIALRRGEEAQVPLMDLLGIINASSARQVADTNFRTSCHTLARLGLLKKYRDLQSLQLSYSMTTEGAETAHLLYKNALSA